MSKEKIKEALLKGQKELRNAHPVLSNMKQPHLLLSAISRKAGQFGFDPDRMFNYFKEGKRKDGQPLLLSKAIDFSNQDHVSDLKAIITDIFNKKQKKIKKGEKMAEKKDVVKKTEAKDTELETKTTKEQVTPNNTKVLSKDELMKCIVDGTCSELLPKMSGIVDKKVGNLSSKLEELKNLLGNLQKTKEVKNEKKEEPKQPPTIDISPEDISPEKVTEQDVTPKPVGNSISKDDLDKILCALNGTCDAIKQVPDKIVEGLSGILDKNDSDKVSEPEKIIEIKDTETSEEKKQVSKEPKSDNSDDGNKVIASDIKDLVKELLDERLNQLNKKEDIKEEKKKPVKDDKEISDKDNKLELVDNSKKEQPTDPYAHIDPMIKKNPLFDLVYKRG